MDFSRSIIITDKGNFFDLMNMTMQICAAMHQHAMVQKKYEDGDKEISLESLALTPREIELTNSLMKLIRLEVNFYSSGLGSNGERAYWGELQTQMMKILPME